MDALSIRDATAADRPALLGLRNTGKLFDDYLRQADGRTLRFLVCERGERVLGFAVLIMRELAVGVPRNRYPRISDLYVANEMRSRGIGTAFIEWMESTALAEGYTEMYMGVDATENKRALELYRRLGYEPMSRVPYRTSGTFHGDDGKAVEREYWRIELVKRMSNE